LLRSAQNWCLAFQGTGNQVTCFRIYRETLSRFSCAASMVVNPEKETYAFKCKNIKSISSEMRFCFFIIF
ncbi:hypothetical protein AAHB54_11055, partial [Bacillus cereus]